MLVAGHKTTCSVLIWTIYLLSQNPTSLKKAQEEADIFPGGYKVDVGLDIMISVYNIHHLPMVWDMADEFIPERFDLNGPMSNGTNTDFRLIPFSGRPRTVTRSGSSGHKNSQSLEHLLQ
ncbi:carotene epsilon-monooxygenase, chloroplastic-like [Cryptomeria japonica]|uniref:carotene epsilon-monooxygenase, chloroplastic-like n=1 Tax=Cryptomeria japonica TaxID=3369 RepID=UPI0027DA3565|nr:carotene epsilon-monooxygenase, chloroplastic-like [Cryptomeria japonica]